ncbi:hypothetical protein [Kineosporia succinea]|uniref:Uncharacterized protein n=1 Tax=Kineosporia succinea TaxID=84632 RepID=A0ABT9P200_9ACTN|nr:hypothetical protein [Kineosporia succinea]MDP9826547.1 hypothetical protein [Kineosporia succinea]
MRKSLAWLTTVAGVAGLLTALPIAGPMSADAATRTDLGAELGVDEIVLATGDRVAVRSTGVVARSERTLVGQTRQGRRLLLPAVALPYLGKTLDASLFDVEQLARTRPASGRIEVEVAYQGAKPSIPGVTITSARGGRATGYLTPDSASAFGDALVKQWHRDEAAGWPKSVRMFGGVTSISSARPARVPAVATPKYKQYTLTVKVTGPDGEPENEGQVALINLDRAAKAYTTLPVVDGLAKVSVPAGNYALQALHYTVDDDAAETEHLRLTTVSDLKVSAARSVTLDHRTATLSATPSTPNPATLQSYYFNTLLTSKDGVPLETYFVSAPFDFAYSPAAAPKAGSLKTFFHWHLSGTDGAYTYDLAARANGIPARSTFGYAASQLTTIKAAYYGDGTGSTAYSGRTALFADQFGAGTLVSPVQLGTGRTEYVGSTGGTPEWGTELDLGDPFDPTAWISDWDSPLKAGTTVKQDWNRGPLAPNFVSGVVCQLCRTNTRLSFMVPDVTDSTLTHAGAVTPQNGKPYNRFRVYAGSKKIYDRKNVLDLSAVKIPAGQTKLRLIHDLDRRTVKSPQNTQSTTEMTFGTKSGTGRKVTGSNREWCPEDKGTCTVPTAVSARLSLPTDLQGRLPSGKSTVTVKLSAVPGAASSAARSATLKVRVTGTSTWTTVKLKSIGGGRFQGVVNNPNANGGRAVDVSFSGTNAAGSTFAQTVLRAYTVAGS